MKLNPPIFCRKADFIAKRFHPTIVGFIPSVRTDLVEKRPSRNRLGLFSGWGIGIRTPTNRVRVCRAAVTQFPSIILNFKLSEEQTNRVCRSGKILHKAFRYMLGDITSPRLAIYRKRYAESVVLPLHNSPQFRTVFILAHQVEFVKGFFIVFGCFFNFSRFYSFYTLQISE